MKTRHIVLVVLILAVMGGYYFKDRRATVDSSDAETSEELQKLKPSTATISTRQQNQIDLNSSDSTATEKPKTSENQAISEAVQKRFAAEVENLEKCLHLSN